MNMNSKIIFEHLHIFVVIAALFVGQFAFSQGFKVKEFKQNISDGSAFNAPMDANGHHCGLIKVRTDQPELQFRGDVVGNVENKTNEYWVYMAKGSGQLGILHPNFLPMTIDFGKYGIAEVDSKATYVLTLAETKYKKEKCGVVMTIKPESAALYVDDVLVENLSGNGYYQLYLPKGDHVCSVKQKGYRPYVQAVTIGKGTQNLNVELESVMAELEIKCRTETAEIYVDDERKGNGTWKGFVFAGNHTIEARQQNFVSSTQTVTIAEKESRSFVIPQLKRAMGKIRIQTTPNNLPISVDSRYVGMSPCTIDLETGSHYIVCEADGLKTNRKDINVSTAQQTVTFKMEYESEKYREAYNGNMERIKELAEDYLWTFHLRCYDSCAEAAVFWRERHSNPNELLDDDWIWAYCVVGEPEKAIRLPQFKKDDEVSMFHIGEAFLKKKEYDKAFQYLSKAGEYGYEGLGDYYSVKGAMQQAASYYRKCLNHELLYDKENIEKKLKDMGY